MTQVSKEENQKWEIVYGKKALPQRREIKPTGRLFINGEYLSLEQTKNYLRTLKEN